METADGVRAHHRWCFRQGYGARDWRPAFLASPSILLAERRPWLFLPASMPKGRQVSFCSESMSSFSGELGCWRRSHGDCGDPSGFVPGVVVVESDRKLCWTRFLFHSLT
eukprot:UN18259